MIANTIVLNTEILRTLSLIFVLIGMFLGGIALANRESSGEKTFATAMKVALVFNVVAAILLIVRFIVEGGAE